MRLRPPVVLLVGVASLVIGYGALVLTGKVRAPWQPPVDLSARLGTSAEVNAILNPVEGSRRDNNTNRDLPMQAALSNIALFPEDPDWWRSRCNGLFSALFRANLAVEYRLRLPEGEVYFPEINALPGDIVLPRQSDEAAFDQMRRYERTLPIDPAEIRDHPVFQTDMPICLEVARGNFPKRP